MKFEICFPGASGRDWGNILPAGYSQAWPRRQGKASPPPPALVRIAPGEPVATGWTLIDFGGSTENPDASHPILTPPWFKVEVTLAFF